MRDRRPAALTAVLTALAVLGLAAGEAAAQGHAPQGRSKSAPPSLALPDGGRLEDRGQGFHSLRALVRVVNGAEVPIGYLCGRREGFLALQPAVVTREHRLAPDRSRGEDVTFPQLWSDLDAMAGAWGRARSGKADAAALSFLTRACAREPQAPPPWPVELGRSEGRQVRLVYDRFEVEGTLRRFWTRWHPSRAATLSGVGPESDVLLVRGDPDLVAKHEVDCRDRRYRLLSGVRYGRGGETPVAPTDWAEAPPGSVMDDVVRRACLID